jgi:hypothetical protein
MQTDDPAQAQQVVVEYARVLERHIEEQRHPAPIDSLPYAKPVIKAAIRTAAQGLAATDQLTDDLREFLELAYVSLADYLDSDLVRLLSEYREAAAELAVEGRLASEKVATPAWRRITESGAIAGEIARAIADDTEALREEFRALIA